MFGGDLGDVNVVYLYMLWSCMLLILNVFIMLNVLINWNDMLKSKGMIVIVLIY